MVLLEGWGRMVGAGLVPLVLNGWEHGEKFLVVELVGVFEWF